MCHKIFVVNSCISNSEYGYKKSLFLWDQFSNKKATYLFLCVDGRNQFKKKLNYLNLNDIVIKSNLSICQQLRI